VGAQEQHDGLAVAVVAFDPGEGLQALAGEAFAGSGRKFGMLPMVANCS
jgi:hypothetical protein